MDKIKLLRDLISKATTDDERQKYEDQLIEAITEKEKADAEAKANAEVESRVKAGLEEAALRRSEESQKIKQGTGDEYKGVKVKKAMHSITRKVFGEKAESYLNANTDGAEYAARFFIDMAQKVQADRGVTKANELITTTDNVGGYLTPTEEEEAILDYVRHTSIALQDATVVPMMSDVMTVPTNATGPSVTIESSEVAITQATPTFGVATLTSKRHSGYIPVSWELDMDNTAGLAAYLADKFVEDLGLTIDSAVFLGPGTLVDGSGVMLNYGASAVMATGSTNFSSVYTGAVFETISKLYPERRTGAKVYAGYANVWAYLGQLTYGTDMPIFDPMAQKLLGYPVRELRQAVATAASKPVFVLGNLKHFLIGSRLANTGLKKIDEKTGLTNYIFFNRLAYANALPNGYAALQTAAV